MAKPLKKMQKRLKARINDFENVKDEKVKSAMKRPGSQNRKKTRSSK